MSSTKKKQLLIPGLKIIWGHIYVYKKELTIVVVLAIALALIEGVIPFIAGRLIDSIIEPQKITFYSKLIYAHVLLLAGWAIAQLIRHVLDWQKINKAQSLGMRIWTDYVANSFSHLLEVPVSFHKSRKLGDLGERIQRAGGELQDIVVDIVCDIGAQFLTFLVAAVIGLYINAILGVVLLLGVVVYAAIMLVAVRPVIALNIARNKAYRRSWHTTYEALGNVHAIKQASTESFEKRKIDRGFKVNIFNAWLKPFLLWQNLTLIQRIIILATQVLVYIISIAMILKGGLTVGELVMFNGYAAMMFGPFVVLGRNWHTVQRGIVSVEQAEGLVTHPREDYAGKIDLKGEVRGDVEFKNVFFKYEKGKTVLENISFNVKAGEVIALVGESGVGKSTLIDLISGYYKPNKGTVTVDGTKVQDHNLHRLRKNIAVVSQEIVLFNDNIYNNIRYGSFNTNEEEVMKAAEKANVSEFVEKFPKKWKQIVGERGIKLSVGQKQRVAIARAILRNPRILILDEPTSALDAKAESIIQESLSELMRGRTTFIIAHRLSTVRNADKIIVLKDGQIVEQGKHDELVEIEGGEYRHLYELQIGLHQ